MHRVVVLALRNVYPFELGIPARIFGAARGPADERLYEVITCSLDGGPVTTSADFAVLVEHGIEALETADTLIIPPFVWDPADQAMLEPPADVFATLRPGTRIVSICTAAVLLAAAGLLDGRPATTHWQEAELCQRLFPQVKWDADVLFVDDGDVLTSAGVAAGVDLCLHIVRRDHGSAVANRAARNCVVPPWRDGGQAQYIERAVPSPSTATTAATQAWALQRLERPLPLTELAGHAQMSVRTFTRRFRQEVGMSPGDWLIRQRVDLARNLLEASRSSRGPDRPPRRVRHGGLAPPAPVRRDRRNAPRLPANVPSGRWIRAPATASRQRIVGGLAGHAGGGADAGPGPAVPSRPPPGHLEAGLKPSPPSCLA